MEAEKSGKVKITVELEVNEALMELIKQNVENMSEMMSKGMANWRHGMGSGMMGHGMMHHGKE